MRRNRPCLRKNLQKNNYAIPILLGESDKAV